MDCYLWTYKKLFVSLIFLSRQRNRLPSSFLNVHQHLVLYHFW